MALLSICSCLRKVSFDQEVETTTRWLVESMQRTKNSRRGLRRLNHHSSTIMDYYILEVKKPSLSHFHALMPLLCKSGPISTNNTVFLKKNLKIPGNNKHSSPTLNTFTALARLRNILSLNFNKKKMIKMQESNKNKRRDKLFNRVSKQLSQANKNKPFFLYKKYWTQNKMTMMNNKKVMQMKKLLSSINLTLIPKKLLSNIS